MHYSTKIDLVFIPLESFKFKKYTPFLLGNSISTLLRLLISISIFSYVFGMFNALMEIDAMQYASISNELLRGENILHLFDNGAPYLDKPPLIFWITALFFKLFGSSDFVYRVPSILFTLLLVYSTYRFSRLYYSENVSQIAALILSSSQALFIMNADVRTDIYMMAPMMLK